MEVWKERTKMVQKSESQRSVKHLLLDADTTRIYEFNEGKGMTTIDLQNSILSVLNASKAPPKRLLSPPNETKLHE